MFSEEGIQKIEQDGSEEERSQERGNEDMEVTLTEGCLAVSKVEVGGRLQSPQRDTSFACKEEWGERTKI